MPLRFSGSRSHPMYLDLEDQVTSQKQARKSPVVSRRLGGETSKDRGSEKCKVENAKVET